MKKYLIPVTFSFLLGSAAAFAQAPPPTKEQTATVSLPETVRLILQNGISTGQQFQAVLTQMSSRMEAMNQEIKDLREKCGDRCPNEPVAKAPPPKPAK